MELLLFVTLTLAIWLTQLYLRSLTKWKARTRGLPLPPGPPRLPIVGNMFDAPKKKPWYGFRDLCARYGDITYLRVLNQDMVILGSPTAIHEVLEKRTANTSDRTVTPLIHLLAIDWLIGLLPYGQKWRTYRRALWQHFHPGAIEIYRPVQRATTRVFLKKLLQNPEHFKKHIRFAFAATVLKIGYNIEVEDEAHEMIETVEAALKGPGEALIPGRFLVDFFPFLRYVPGWVPGAGFQKKFAVWREATLRLKDTTFLNRNTSFTNNAMPHCTPIVDSLLSRFSDGDGDHSFEVENLVKDVVAVTFEAGTDTTYSILAAVFLAMALYPEVQRKAQAELDAIVGPRRLPDFQDRESLVYINAIVKEALRWHNVTPLSIPHRSIHDDECGGYFIPAGTMLIPNIWACMHDPDVYEQPEAFRPERFIRDGKLDPSVRDPFDFAFGSGRRICPGRYFADEALFHNIACVLHVFNIAPPLDDSGQPVQMEYCMTDGFMSYPEDCRCIIKPRLPAIEALLTREHAIES